MQENVDTRSFDLGSYMWPRGKIIELEKEDDRFTIIPISPPSGTAKLELLGKSPGVIDIKLITNRVFKVKTSAIERDYSMSS
jgi:hypothetical protein